MNLSEPSRDAALAGAFRSLSRALEYPDSGLEPALRAAHEKLEEAFPQACLLFDRFAAAFLALDQDRREELSTATFDITPACVPYVSIHLFGEENFKRGEFMASLGNRHAEAGFDSRGELPDHIAVLLRFAAEIDEAERRELVEFCLLGPVEKMISSLSEENPYRALLETIKGVLRSSYPHLQPAPSPLEQMRRHGAACDAVSAGCGCRTQQEIGTAELSKNRPNY